MQPIQLSKLQELANFLHLEPNSAKRNQMAGWIENVNRTPSEYQFSELLCVSDSSSLKTQVRDWVNSLTDKVSEFTQPIYIPDIPAQMEVTEEVIEVGHTSAEIDTLIETKEISIPEDKKIEIPDEVIEKAKKPRKKKED